MKRTFRYLLIAISTLILSSCSDKKTEPLSATTLEEWPEIFPDYIQVTVPKEIAPLRFMLKNQPEDALVSISFEKHKLVCAATAQKGFLLDEEEWEQLLQAAAGQTLEVKVYEKKGEEWVMYRPFPIHVSADPVDSYLAYRRIEPGYESWNQMGIYQRNLTGFDETAIIQNKLTEHNCINCHSFVNQKPDKMLFHMRGNLGGTYLAEGDRIKKLNGKINGEISSLVYPAWHPSGNFVAFSTNQTRQAFHTNDKNRIEVFDYTSDILLYDVAKNEAFTVPSLFAKDAFETFPTFSPDGKRLYFCSAHSQKMPEAYKEVRYSLCSIEFHPETRTFGDKVDTLFNAREQGRSVSFPRVSPEGNFLVFTLSNYGNFSIWHQEADLYMVHLKDRTIVPLESANSDRVESYHSWSSNGKWLVFSSRRIDGLYTRPYLVHINEDGTTDKPFVLPQKEAGYYRSCMQSFNIPEFIEGKVTFSGREIADEARSGKAQNIAYSPYNP